jgi:hypothetical protein
MAVDRRSDEDRDLSTRPRIPLAVHGAKLAGAQLIALG